MKPTMAVTIDPPLLAQIRAVAAAERRPLSWVVGDLLALGLSAHGQGRREGGGHGRARSERAAAGKRDAAEVQP